MATLVLVVSLVWFDHLVVHSALSLDAASNCLGLVLFSSLKFPLVDEKMKLGLAASQKAQIGRKSDIDCIANKHVVHQLATLVDDLHGIDWRLVWVLLLYERFHLAKSERLLDCQFDRVFLLHRRSDELDLDFISCRLRAVCFVFSHNWRGSLLNL